MCNVSSHLKTTSSNLNKRKVVYKRCSIKKDILRNFAKFTGKHLSQRLFFNKVEGRYLL